MIAWPLLLVAAAAQNHVVTVTHAGTPLALTYEASTAISHRQIGSVAPPGKPSTLRCLWTATVAVHRRAARAGAPVTALSRQVSASDHFSGSHHGACSQARAAINREVASRAADHRDHLIAVADRDRPAVLAELESVRTLTSSDQG